jgi:DNA-binding NarL/FixJ family response regulator
MLIGMSHVSSQPPVDCLHATARIGVMVVDDHEAVRLGVCRLLDDQPDLRVVAQASSATAALHVASHDVDVDVDVAVVDYHLGERTGLWLARRLRQLNSPPQVLVYSAFSDYALVIASMVAGVDGLLSKSVIGEELCLAVRQLAGGGRYMPAISPTVARGMSAQVDPRLRPIFSMISQDISPSQIRQALGISAAELDVARDAILSTLAPASRGRWRAAPATALDYDRPKRRWRSGRTVG